MIGSMLSRTATAALLSTMALGAGAAYAETVNIAQNFDPQTLWPNGTTASDNLNAGSAIVESLFWQNPASGEIEPLLATVVEMVSDTEALLTLREGVSFTNGEPMNADAVVHSIEIFMDEEQTPAYARVSDLFESVEKVDDLTVRITLSDTFPAFMLALSQISVVPPSHWNEVGLEAYGQQPIGTGPFVFESWTRDDRLVMSANADYWGDAPDGITELVWRPVPEDAARLAGLQTGEFQIVKDLPVSSIPTLENDDSVSLITVPSYRIYQIGLASQEQHESPLQDVAVRQALNYAVDSQLIIDALFFGRAIPLNGQVLREPQPGYNPDLGDYGYDPERARAMLAEAGYPDGFEIDFKCPSGRYAQDREVCEAVAGMLAEVGVTANLIMLEPGEFLRQLRTMELAPMYFVGLAPQDDPGFQASQYLSEWRYSPIANEEMDELILAGATEADPESRAQIYRDLMALMHEQAPIIFLYGGVDIYGTDARITGLEPRGDGRMFFYNVELEE
ncbi:ABC transporter substrate-binding protein [Oceanibium sediminis]|uniref:ABC transporter substrate-binding protein n=1 Tax=Oceanibium sediminis TaxID=2026339 RepID=UPI000DD3F5F5|nr:ABC transporter substrate-binding protein [Oceanibium sediminis]